MSTAAYTATPWTNRYAAQPWVVNCWVHGANQFGEVPDCVLGPYISSDAALEVAKPLTCPHRVERLRMRLDPPEWTSI